MFNTGSWHNNIKQQHCHAIYNLYFLIAYKLNTSHGNTDVCNPVGGGG